MDIPHTNIVYHFEQRVEIMYRESEKTSPTNEAYQRQGLILLSTGVEDSRWKREIAEYEVAPAELDKIRQRDKVDRAELQKAQLKALGARRTPFGLDFSVEVDSDMHNKEVVMTGTQGAPLRQDLLYLPTLLPAVPDKRPEPGDEWNGAIEIAGGPARFRVSYTAKMLERIGDDPKINVTLQPQSATQTVKDFTFTLSPQGHLVTLIAKAGGSPLSSEGDFRISIRAKFDRDGTPVDVEVLNCHQTFTLTRVPASFNDDTFLPAGWKLPPEKKPNPP